MAAKQRWTEKDIPDMTGKVAIVTGANIGIGYEAACALAQKGATVVMACRNLQRANAAADQIGRTNPSGPLDTRSLDLGNLDAVRAFAMAFQQNYQRLDLLINNAGVMIPPYGKTAQGFEVHFGVNHIGHFALTGLLIDLLNRTPYARVVTVSSVSHRQGRIEFEQQNGKWRYLPGNGYPQSKLANLLFTYELQRRLTAAGKDTLSVAAHPGLTLTGLQRHSQMLALLARLFGQSQLKGALPTLYAATAAGVQGGAYFGPDGLFEVWGYPKIVSSSRRSTDQAAAQRLWQLSEEMTGVVYPLG